MDYLNISDSYPLINRDETLQLTKINQMLNLRSLTEVYDKPKSSEPSLPSPLVDAEWQEDQDQYPPVSPSSTPIVGSGYIESFLSEQEVASRVSQCEKILKYKEEMAQRF